MPDQASSSPNRQRQGASFHYRRTQQLHFLTSCAEGKQLGRRPVEQSKAKKVWGSRPTQGAADGDEIVGDDAEAYPALHAGVALVAAAVEAMSALDHADAALAAGAPGLTSAEPALLLFAPALRTFG